MPVTYLKSHMPGDVATGWNGLVLSLGDRQIYDEHLYFALCWNPATGRPEEVVYECYYCGTANGQGKTSAQVDATPEARAAFEAYKAAQAAQEAERKAAEEAVTIRRGKRVRVVKGRKVPIGTEGPVFWIGDSKYGTRVGIETPAGRVFTAVSNVDIVGIAPRWVSEAA